MLCKHLQMQLNYNIILKYMHGIHYVYRRAAAAAAAAVAAARRHHKFGALFLVCLAGQSQVQGATARLLTLPKSRRSQHYV